MSLEFELPLVSLIFIIMLMILYFSKKRINIAENKFYEIILISSFIEIILDTLLHLICATNNFSVITTNYYNFFDITNKILSTLFVIIFTSFYLYILSITYKNIKSKIKKSYFWLILIAIIFFIITLFTRIELIQIGYVTNVIGSTITLSYIIVAILLIASLIIALINIKKFDRRYIPIFVVLGELGTLYVITLIFPGMIIYDLVLVLMCYIMYFTIENPDVKMIAQLNEAKSQAEKANNAKSEFLSSMSHEIRTPLNAIVGFSQALSEEELSAEAREEVKDIISASNTLLDIVNGILDISKIEANKLEIINKEYSFKDVFDELVALTKGRLGEKPLDFKYIYDESIPSVLYGDSVRVKQIILNLLTNSVKYTKEGSITFTVNSVKKDDVIRLIVSVEDTGIGIKEENIGKLFTKFERFDEKNTTIEGTGLGLAITKQLVELMNGKIVVQSIHGKGSKFTVAIDQKIVHGKVIETKTSDEDVVEFDLTGKKILIVDDNNLNLKVASRLIKNYKCDITTVTSGMDCIDKINNKEVFDLILMDDMMPRMSGGETLIRLKKIEGFNIPVVALTANAVTGMREKYLALGFDDYLAKPIEKGELNRVLHKFLKED